MHSIYYTETPLQTIRLGEKLGQTLKGGDIVLLFGDLGAGKTHFVKGIAEGLGIQELIKSPTFAYVNTYPIGRSSGRHPRVSGDLSLDSRLRGNDTKGGGLSTIFYHYDLYRMEKAADLTSLGYEETIHNPDAINVVEWADRLDDRLPDRYIRVNFLSKGNTRSIEIQYAYSTRLSEASIESYYQEWQTPLHVRAHCKKVAYVSQKIAEAYTRAGEIIDLSLAYTGGMLHDMCRVCDFRAMDRAKFQEEITEPKWQKWLTLREKYKGMHHADIAHNVLADRGFTETAEVIRLHRAGAIITDPKAFDTLEKKIVAYADKRVKHDTIVSLAERFRDGRERYAQYDNDDEKMFYLEVEKKAKKLENELFKPLDIEPEDI